LTCETPRFESEHSISEFGESDEEGIIDLTQFVFTADKTSNNNFKELTDGFMTTYYSSANAQCSF